MEVIKFCPFGYPSPTFEADTNSEAQIRMYIFGDGVNFDICKHENGGSDCFLTESVHLDKDSIREITAALSMLSSLIENP